MDASLILAHLFSNLWYLAPLFLVVAFLKSPWFKGVFGEWQVNLLLTLLLPKDQYRLIKNVTMPTADGTTQIDHILVSKYGIFVIETKNMKGWIFGNAQQKQWTQKIFKQSHKFQNPIHQNYKHLKTLEGCLKIAPEHLHSVIVFIGDSTFKSKMPPNVTYARGCVDYIKSFKTEVLSIQEVRRAVKRVESGRLEPNRKTHRAHVVHLKARASEKAKEKQCPKCGGTMVKRQARKGKHAGKVFWGCTGFPKCKTAISAEG